MTSELLTHDRNMRSAIVSRDDLAHVTAPEPLGPKHAPVPHAVLVATIDHEIAHRGYQQTGATFALARGGASLFGVIDLAPRTVHAREYAPSLGFRTSNDRTLALRMVAGARVFVCDNLALSGDMIAMHRLHTTGLDLESAVADGFERFLQHSYALDRHIERMRATPMTDHDARAMAFTVFADGVLPVRLLDDVHRAYFETTDDQPDCQPRTLWALHNAFTRTMADLPLPRRFNSSVALGRYFGMRQAIQAPLRLTLD